MSLRPVLLIAIALFTTAASAHLLKVDGDVGVVMHIDPGDAPVEREKAMFFVEIKDRSSRFAPARCDCRLLIATEGRELFNEKIFLQGAQSAAASFVFPAAGIYRVEVAGAPVDGGAFQAFHIPFDVRVERNENSQGPAASALTRYWPMWTALLVAVLGAVFVAWRKK